VAIAQAQLHTFEDLPVAALSIARAAASGLQLEIRFCLLSFLSWVWKRQLNQSGPKRLSQNVALFLAHHYCHFFSFLGGEYPI